VPNLGDGQWHSVKLPLTADSTLGAEWDPKRLVELDYAYVNGPATFTAWVDDCVAD
jgi:hypothetical protein